MSGYNPFGVQGGGQNHGYPVNAQPVAQPSRPTTPRALGFSDPNADYTYRGHQASISAGGVLEIHDRALNTANASFLYGVDLRGNLHVVDDGQNADYQHTNCLGRPRHGAPFQGWCFGEIATDQNGKVIMMNNRSGHSLPTPEHFKYALSLPALAQLSSTTTVEIYSAQDSYGNASIQHSTAAQFR
jgi:hypothetical protein